MIQIAKDYIDELNLNVVYASVGGSVGREDADKYSDLDLTIYTNTNSYSTKLDLIYSGEIIQLEILHMDELPNEQIVHQNPWDCRFIVEQTIIKDYDGIYRGLKEYATVLFNTSNGKKRMYEQVSTIVRKRNEYALECLDNNNFYSANLAAMGAWAEAGFLYLFINNNSLSTGGLIPQLRKLKTHVLEFENATPFSMKLDLSEIPKILSNFRKFLREEGHAYVALSDVHDALCDRKIQRLLHKNERLNLIWQMYGEAVGLYFATSNGLTMEQYFQNLPKSLQKDLTKIGFVPLNERKVKELSRLSEELLSFSC